MEFSAYWPDLNSIETWWNWMKDYAEDRYFTDYVSTPRGMLNEPWEAN